MIRAVCFDKNSMKADTIERICTETMGRLGGFLTDPSMVNCIESFPDGRIYFSYIGKRVPKTVYNCHNDVNLFIQANSGFGLISRK